MQWKRWLSIHLCLVAALVLAAGLVLVPASRAGGAPAADAGGDTNLDGKEIFLSQKCNLCHSVSSADIEAKTKSEKVRGPDLVDVGERHQTDFLLEYLRKEAEIDGEKHNKAFTGSDEELGALVAWLEDQKAE